jgi:trans-2,3-dihydro-3-hydroxyanthranilate isomerase
MTGNLKFYIVDVFAEGRFTGNPLAVIRGAERLSDDEMLSISQEMHYSETTFILSDEMRDGGYDVRIFTTVSELPFAGHPTLGTAFIIRQEIAAERPDEVVLHLKVGPIPVTFNDDDMLWMRQNPPEFGHTFDVDTVADVLSLLPGDLDDRYPVQEVSTGLPFIIAPLRTLDAVKRATISLPRFDAMIGGVGSPLRADMLMIFCPETERENNDLHARVFTHHHGPPEDPATGSANGCLAAYLSKYRYFSTNEVNCRVEQGYEIGRPSLLLLRADTDEDGSISVNVGGHVRMVARGELLP